VVTAPARRVLVRSMVERGLSERRARPSPDDRRVTLRLIEPGKPNQNAYVESFNVRFRDECLNEHWFTSLGHAQVVIETWRREYNEERPKKGPGGLTPRCLCQTADDGNEYSHRRTLKGTATQTGGTSAYFAFSAVTDRPNFDLPPRVRRSSSRTSPQHSGRSDAPQNSAEKSSMQRLGSVWYR